MSNKNTVLILTDSTTHKGIESLFSIAAHLSVHPGIAHVYVVDRADAQNGAFFKQHEPSFTGFYARKIDDKFSFEQNPLQSYAGTVIGPDDFDAVWIRIDHPVSDDFLRYLRALLPDHFIINDTDGLIRTMSKEFLLELQAALGDLMPAIRLCDNVDDVIDFKQSCPNGIVLKQVLSYGGKGVVRWRDNGDSDIHSADEAAKYLADNGLCLAMEYMTPPGRQSDRRVVIMNGTVVNVLDRIAKEGGWLCNLTSGATAELGDVTAREIDIAKRLDPIMRGHGIFLYGADLLVNSKGERVLSEVNTLNVGTIAVAERLSGKPLTKFVADNLAAVIAARSLDVPVSNEDQIAA